MQLSSLLRPEQVKKYWRRTRASLEEELFKIYDADLKHQLYNGGSRGRVYCPVCGRLLSSRPMRGWTE